MNPNFGVCRRLPPSAGTTQTYWPVTHRHLDWCAEHSTQAATDSLVRRMLKMRS